MDSTAGNLPYADWDDLNESAVQLRAYANLIHTTAPEPFLLGEIEYASRLIDATRTAAAEHGWFEKEGAS